MVDPGDLVQKLAANPKLRGLLEDAGGSEALAGLDEWAKESSLVDAQPSTAGPPGPAVIDAALSYARQNTEEEERRLIDHSEAITIDGLRWLRLKDEGRLEILRSATERELEGRLKEHEAADSALMADQSPDRGIDVPLASAWLRELLRGRAQRFGDLHVRHLRAVSAAVSSLSACRSFIPTLPEEAEVERWMGLAELRQPLEILVGQQSPGQDRFVGRADEMRRLREFVDVLGSQSAYEAVSRGLKRLGRSLANRSNALGLTLVAGGGLGKSTLVAKFALDHFLQPQAAIPFVYFDFDRASLQPREPNQLLIEAARQVALEIPLVAAPLSLLRRRLRNDLSDRDRGYDVVEPVSVTTSEPATDPYVEFTNILREAARKTPAGVALIVFDTMEIVQSDPEALSGIVHFLRRLCERPFPELRIVAAGRAEVAELSEIPGLEMVAGKMELDALGIVDAREMVGRLGRLLMNDGWNDAWTRMLVGADREPKERRTPLTLRVALELLRDAVPGEREGLVREIAELGATANTNLVGRIYVQRIIRHVRDKDAQAMAWPGLVARRITRDVLRNVIAPVCGLAASTLDTAFDKLAREVWIVERDGDALIHRSDLRARTLPFMRAHDKDVFDRLTLALRDYYRTAGDTVEASYYRLLSGEHPDFLTTEIEGGVFNRLARAAEDFATDWHPKDMPHARLTYAYLRSRRGPLMQRKVFAALPPELAFSHLRRAGAGVCTFDDTKAHPVLSAFRNAEVSISRMGRDDLVTRQTLLIKTGEWWPLQKADLLIPSEPRDAEALAFYLARQGAKDGRGDLAVSLAAEFLPSLGGDAWRVSAYLLPYLRRFQPDLFSRCDFELARMPPERITDKPATVGAVRSALSVAQESFSVLIQRWGELTAMQAESTSTLSAAEAARLKPLLENAGVRARIIFNEREERLIADVSSGLSQRRPFRMESLALSNFSQGVARNPSYWEPAGPRLRAFFNARHDDWVVPVGYAIQAELSRPAVASAVKSLFEGHEPPKGLGGWARAVLSSRSNVPTDGIEIARRANEASDIASLLAAVRRHGSNAGAANIGLLEAAFDTWERLLDAGLRDLSGP